MVIIHVAIFADAYGCSLAILFFHYEYHIYSMVVKQENMEEIEPSFNLTKKCMSITKSIDVEHYEEMKDIVLSVPNIRSGLSPEKRENSSFNDTKKMISITKTTDVEYYEKNNERESVPLMVKQENMDERESVPLIVKTETMDEREFVPLIVKTETMDEREFVNLIVKQENMDEVDPLCNDTNKIVSKTKTTGVNYSKEMEDISVPSNMSSPFSGPEHVDMAKFLSEASEKIMSISKSTMFDYYKIMKEVRTFIMIEKFFFKVGFCIMLVFYLFM